MVYETGYTMGEYVFASLQSLGVWPIEISPNPILESVGVRSRRSWSYIATGALAT